MSANQDNPNDSIAEAAVAQGNAYDVIRRRLQDQATQLDGLVKEINAARIAEFGSTELKIQGRSRIRTDNNCVARDLVRVGGYLLFGYNLFVGLRKDVLVGDVFSAFHLVEEDSGIELEPVAQPPAFLQDARFQSDFKELYTYYKEARLLQLTVRGGKLLACFQIGARPTDIRVFRWTVAPDGSHIEYIDNRGERDIQLPPQYDFDWVPLTREDVIAGRHPHYNVLDTLFLDTLGGTLTVKVENNTHTGLGIFAEPVLDDKQSLDDGEFAYASVGQLILLRVKPYREEDMRYLVFNRLTQSVVRIDAIGQSCVQLPEDHGIIFPGGYYLQTGDYKTLEGEDPGLRFKRVVRSPNGEDVLYIFYEPLSGKSALYPYNLIDKTLRNPLYAHGYGLFDDGRMVVFMAEDEPTRVHPMQVWQTPFVSDMYASQQPPSQSLYGRIGNAELVRGISDLFTVVRLVHKKDIKAAHFHELIRTASRLFDQYHWLGDPAHKAIETLLRQIIDTAELIIDEYEKVESIRRNSLQALQTARDDCDALLSKLKPEFWTTPQPFVEGLAEIRQLRGHLLTVRSYRYMDVDAIDGLQEKLVEAQESLALATVDFLARDAALQPVYEDLARYEEEADEARTRAELIPVIERIAGLGEGLDLLTETLSGIRSADATLRTTIIDNISALYSKLNQAKARADNKRRSLGSAEALAQFSAQFKLLAQSVTAALGMATTPDRCDEQLSRLMSQLQELESQFSDYDEFLADILQKREEIFETFESHKQRLQEERQRRAGTLADAAQRLIVGIQRRAQSIKDEDQLNTLFASDPLVEKIRELAQQLRELDDTVKADDIDARFKALRDQSLRALRDKSEIYEEGGQVIRLGPRHRFSVNTQELDLTIVPRGDDLYFHLSGTDFYELLDDPVINESRAYWPMTLVSETPQVSRAEYLAYSLLQQAEARTDGWSLDVLLSELGDEDALLERVRRFAEPRYREGYERGIHDQDATRLLRELLPLYQSAGLLRYDPAARALAQLFWRFASGSQVDRQGWPLAAQSARMLQKVFAQGDALAQLRDDVGVALQAFADEQALQATQDQVLRAVRYLVDELAQPQLEFVQTRASQQLLEQLRLEMNAASAWSLFEQQLRHLEGQPGKAFRLAVAWLEGYVRQRADDPRAHYVHEAAAVLLGTGKLRYRVRELDLTLRVDGMLSQHTTFKQGNLVAQLDAYLLRMDQHCQVVVPGYQRYLEARQALIERERKRLRLDQFKAKPLSSFVRNKLINESYLPIIGDNLAKQMGTVGDNKRTDLTGLLMLISPPGYGKTTLMEYVANRLGLVFMKINCPSIGHVVDSLDPSQAPNATARQELEKLNLGLEMGSNTMLYLDDIQHTNPEFLQKFISLCDGTRRIEGVWQGETRTYDMRGKKFCVVMAGNPYTETGEVFRIPDMLANRADIYNLGDVFTGMEEVFALSYIENGMTSNPVLAPLATRQMADFYQFVDRAKGREVADTDFDYPYSGAEINEIVTTLQKLFTVQEVVLKVNQQYILSAAQNDQYRTEPPFKLQGSYRNMNKMAEKVSAVMTGDELLQLIDDHYQGEAQLLTTGTEQNLLKLAELRGNMTPEQAERWAHIKAEFVRQKSLGGDDADVGTKVVAQLYDMATHLKQLGVALGKPAAPADTNQKDASEAVIRLLQSSQQLVADKLDDTLGRVTQALAQVKHEVKVVQQPVPGIDKVLKALASTLETSIFPLVQSMDGKLGLDLKTHHLMKQVLDELAVMRRELSGTVPATGHDGQN